MLFNEPTATPNQLQALAQILPENQKWQLRDLTKSAASNLIKENQDTWAKLPATSAQEEYLRKTIQWKTGMTRGDASAIISKDKARW